MKIKRGNIFLLMWLIGLQASVADIYFWKDAAGKQHFSDTPQPNAVKYQKSTQASYYVVKKVFDGDTVQLKDGRKIRLLGINTPEVAHRNNPAQKGGDAAKKWLSETLLGKRVRLQFGVEKKDKYKRDLAHLFTDYDLHINLELVKRGFASVNIFPPNIAYADELMIASNSAENSKLGVWNYSSYQTKLVKQLNKNNKQGWQRIVGKIIKIQRTRKNVYLFMSDSFKLRIKKQHLQFFVNPDDLLGEKVEARGWVHKNKSQLVMQLKHASVLKIL